MQMRSGSGSRVAVCSSRAHSTRSCGDSDTSCNAAISAIDVAIVADLLERLDDVCVDLVERQSRASDGTEEEDALLVVVLRR